MKDRSHPDNRMQSVVNFQELVSTPFRGHVNALCWRRELKGDFSEIINKVTLNGNISVIEQEELRELQLSEQGQLAREILLNDFELLKAHGASPVLNVINYYERDDSAPFFPTDVYSFHVDRSPVPTDTFLCTYHGESSEILPNSQGQKKVLLTDIRNELRKQFHSLSEGTLEVDDGFETYLSENFFDLHYQANADARPISCGLGHLWRLAVDHPGSPVLPCIHRAPEEKPGVYRLLMIC